MQGTNFKEAAYVTNELNEVVVVTESKGDPYYVKEIMQEHINIAKKTSKPTLMRGHERQDGMEMNESNKYLIWAR